MMDALSSAGGSKKWVAELQKLDVFLVVRGELRRFMGKFDLREDEVTMEPLDVAPYVKLSAEVPVTVGHREFRVKFRNFNPFVGFECYGSPVFDELDWLVANRLRDVFGGDVCVFRIFCDLFLVVVSGDDTVCVTSRLDAVEEQSLCVESPSQIIGS